MLIFYIYVNRSTPDMGAIIFLIFRSNLGGVMVHSLNSVIFFLLLFFLIFIMLFLTSVKIRLSTLGVNTIPNILIVFSFFRKNLISF